MVSSFFLQPLKTLTAATIIAAAQKNENLFFSILLPFYYRAHAPALVFEYREHDVVWNRAL